MTPYIVIRYWLKCCLKFFIVFAILHLSESQWDIDRKAGGEDWGRCHAARCGTKGCYTWLWSASCGGRLQSTNRQVASLLLNRTWNNHWLQSRYAEEHFWTCNILQRSCIDDSAWAWLNTTAYLIIVADHVHPFMITMYSSSDNSITGHVTKLRSSHCGFSNMIMSSAWSNGLHSHQNSVQ